MYSPPPDPTDEQRMREASAQCLLVLGGRVSGPDVWGWHGRTISNRVEHPTHGACWLRVVSAPADKAAGKVWEGNRLASCLFDARVRKPLLHAYHEESYAGRTYLAELAQYIAEPMCSQEPVLRHPLSLPAAWWNSLRADLNVVASAATDRVAVRQEWVARCVPQFLGIPAPRVEEWETAHGDMHFANLTKETPYLLDWEGFGMAPAGYDAAMLLCHSLLIPDFAGHVRDKFPILKTDAGRTAQLIVITELMQAASRGDNTDLVPPLTALAAKLV